MSIDSDIQTQQDLERRTREKISATQEELARQQRVLADIERKEADLMARKADEAQRETASTGGGGIDLF